jgi:predicted ester cyclase
MPQNFNGAFPNFYDILRDLFEGVILDMEATSLPLQPSFAREFAQEWVDAWNSHDLERILTHYEDEVHLSSPVALKLLKGDGTVHGKASLREYFLLGIQAFPNLHFDLIDTLWGTETIVICYVNNVRGSKTAEVMLLSPAGKIRRVWANYNQ